MITTDQNNNLNFNKNTVRYKIYEQYFLLNNTNKDDIARKLNTTVSNISSTISWLKKRVLVEGSISTNNTSTNNNTDTLEQSILVKIYENNNKLILYVKTSEDFENWLKAHKEIRSSTNLFRKGNEGKFYYIKISNTNLQDDDINMPIINNGKINFGVLRIPGIAQGLEFELDGLLTETLLADAVKKLLEAYKKFYNKNILYKKINITGEVLHDKI